MSAATYFDGAQWGELVDDRVLGRPVQVFRQRPVDVLDVLTLTSAPPEMDFLVQGQRRLTFGKFLDGVDRGADALREHGVGPGDRVLVVLYNSIEFLLVQWAAWRLRAVPVLGNRWWSPPDIAEIVERVRPKIVVTDLDTGDELHGVTRLAPDDVRQWWTRPAVDLPPTPPADEDDVVLLVFTAGSTGAPKAAQLTHRVLWATQQTLHMMMGGRPPVPETSAEQGVALMTTPMFHNGAVVAGIAALLDGSRIVLLPGRFDAEEVLSLIQAERVSSWNAVPTMYARMLAHPDFADYDLTSLRSPSTGGAMVPQALLDRVAEKMPHVVGRFAIGYGMTEMSFLTIVPATTVTQRPGTVGKAIPGVELQVFEPDDRGEGEIVGRSAAMMAGYFGVAEQPIDGEGWYHTGDVGRIDDGGFLYLTGRLDDMVIRGGENIASPRVEEAIAAHRDVREVAVVGIPDHELGEELAAIVQLRGGVETEQDELVAFTSKRLAYFEVPTRWVFTPDPLPVLPTGKVDKMRLRQALRDAANG